MQSGLPFRCFLRGGDVNLGARAKNMGFTPHLNVAVISGPKLTQCDSISQLNSKTAGKQLYQLKGAAVKVPLSTWPVDENAPRADLRC